MIEIAIPEEEWRRAQADLDAAKKRIAQLKSALGRMERFLPKLSGNTNTDIRVASEASCVAEYARRALSRGKKR